LIEAVERGKASVDWHKCDREGNPGAYIPLPATYLRGERWDDEYKVSLSSIKVTVTETKVPVAIPKPTQEQVEAARRAIAQAGLRLVG
jgi:hypothetical protein